MKRSFRLTTMALLFAVVHAAAMAGPDDETVPNNSALDRELFYRILVGELSAQNGDNPTAYALILDSARKTNSARLYERAVELALTAHDGEAALKAAQDWARALPTSLEANRYLLQILLGLNRMAESAEPVKRTLAALSTSERLGFIALLPRLYARVQDKKLAATLVEQALAAELGKAATGPTSWATLGYLRLAANDTSGAQEAVRQGAALNPLAEEPVFLALTLLGPQNSAAETLVRKFLTHQPPSATVRMGYARKLIDLQRYAEAHTQLQLLTTEKPAMGDAWLLRGSLELIDNKLAAAEASFKTYVALATAAAALTPAAEMDRGLVQAYLYLADIAEKNQKLDEATAYLLRIDSPQDILRVQTRRASILARQGHLDQARALIRALPESKPTDAAAKTLAEVQLLRDYKQYPAAYELLTQAMARNPDDVDLMYELSTVAEKTGKLEEMETLLRRIIASKPDYHAAYNALGYSLADRKLRLPEARQLIKKALEFAPEDPFIVDSLAWVEFRSGNSTEALRLLQGAFKARPDAEIAAHLGEVLWDLGDHRQAADIWSQGKRLNPTNETLLETIKRLSSPP